MKNESKIVEDYRVALRGGLNLYACILNASDEAGITQEISTIYPKCNIEFLDNDDLEDSFYAKLFSDKTPYITIDKGRRRFDALLGTKETEKPYKTPVMTFYSYKGGMGRSTTLAAFAMHLALNENKKVMIIDCDFEAPGFSNFYLKHSGEENQRKGLVEYFLDKQTESSIEIDNYTYEVDEKYRGIGSIRIMPAGNLGRYTKENANNHNTNDFLTDDLHHYLEGLSRIEFSYADYITTQFENLIQDLEQNTDADTRPDVILIDSRTGFSDIMGITALHLSNCIVGFFRNDAQSLPGLHFFLEQAIEKDTVEPIIVNSILPANLFLRKELFKRFEGDVKEILSQFQNEEEGLNDLPAFPIFPIARNENLEILGTTIENTDDLIELIKTKEIKDYKNLFEKLSSIINKNNKEKPTLDTIETTISTKSESIIEVFPANTFLLEKAPDIDEINKANDENKNIWRKAIRERILNATAQKISKIDFYGDNTDVKKDFEEKLFFYRNSMHDFFNVDKVLIIGGKGTGKSYMYRALKDKEIVIALQKRANRTENNYTFFYTIDKTNRIFRVNAFLKPTDEFKKRFWLVYTWLILIKEIKQMPKMKDYKTIAGIEIFDIKDDSTTKIALEKIINDDEKIIAIEKDMTFLDHFLREKGNGKKEYITLIYDQLDEIVAPENWNEWLPSLINFWKFKRYGLIFGKLFVRKDLFKRLRGVTNINDLENQAIDIEWSQEEMFAYFFKIVLSNGDAEWFWSQMYLLDTPNIVIKQLRKKYNNLEQLPLNKSDLLPLTNLFFGEMVDVDNTTRFGYSYDWFFDNLKNADNTISLRVFIELLKAAFEKVDNFKNPVDSPILYQKAYTDKDVRIKAVEKHFGDLSKENGNKPLEYIFEYIVNNKSYQLVTLVKQTFETMLTNLITEKKEKKEMQGQTVESLAELLITNGIAKKDNIGKGDFYKFAYLYKYRLGLKGS